MCSRWLGSTVLSLLVVVLAVLFNLGERNGDSKGPELSELSSRIRKWHRAGQHVDVFGDRMFVVDSTSSTWRAEYPYTDHVEHADNDVPVTTYVLVHGFPTSSFDYHRVMPQLARRGRVVAMDHIGFGFSDKPQGPEQVYSLIDHAERLLELCRIMSLRNAHFVSHDMGDSVLTEALTRLQRGVAPTPLNELVRSLTFTNGGMVYDLIPQLFSQRLLTSPLGPFATRNMPEWMGAALTRIQLAKIWGDKRATITDDIEDIYQLIRFNDGHKISHRLIAYLPERHRYEMRWFTALAALNLKSTTKIPIRLAWGDRDAVSPANIAIHLAEKVLGLENANSIVKILHGTGHFISLEAPEAWLEAVP